MQLPGPHNHTRLGFFVLFSSSVSVYVCNSLVSLTSVFNTSCQLNKVSAYDNPSFTGVILHNSTEHRSEFDSLCLANSNALSRVNSGSASSISVFLSQSPVWIWSPDMNSISTATVKHWRFNLRLHGITVFLHSVLNPLPPCFTFTWGAVHLKFLNHGEPFLPVLTKN